MGGSPPIRADGDMTHAPRPLDRSYLGYCTPNGAALGSWNIPGRHVQPEVLAEKPNPTQAPRLKSYAGATLLACIPRRL